VQGNPRLVVALEKMLHGLSRVFLGASVVDVVVRSRSNRDLLGGRIAALTVDVGEMAGPILCARGASLRGTQLDLGIRPLLVFLYFPIVLFGIVDFLSMTLLTIAAYFAVPPASPSSSLLYSLSLNEQDLNGSFAIRWILGLALSTLMRNSMLISAIR
jgi:hypothetical protein